MSTSARARASDHRRALLENAFFTEAKLDGDALTEMAAALEERRFAKGERIFGEGALRECRGSRWTQFPLPQRTAGL